MEKEKCVICGTSMKDGSTMVFSKNRRTTCHSHQNYGKNTEPGSHNCLFDCHFQEPYGFVAEDGCPVHDSVEEIPQFNGTLEALNNLTLK